MFEDNKIELLSEIQKRLIDLSSNSGENEINEIMNLIPQDIHMQKDFLMLICQLIALYVRKTDTCNKKNAIIIYSKLMPILKTCLQDESNFFWQIFGSQNYFKLWLYNEGLISFEQIIISCVADDEGYTTEFFLPEIIEKAEEIYEMELKFFFKGSFTKESLQEYKILREKYFKWICSSGDYNDPIYHEIEHDRLRLAIKTDNVEAFQQILSNSNVKINSEIQESALENSLINPQPLSLIEYSMDLNATSIVKFLILNDAKIHTGLLYSAIGKANYEMFHLFESRLLEEKEDFGEVCLADSISTWNSDMIEYSIDKYDFGFLFDKSIQCIDFHKIYRITAQAISSSNFMFFNSFLLPFFKNNEKIFNENIYDIIEASLYDQSGYFTKEFMKHPGIDINHHLDDSNNTLLSRALSRKNSKAAEFLLKDPNIDINMPACKTFTVFHLACRLNLDLKLFKMLANHPKLDLNYKDKSHYTIAYHLAAPCGNFYALQYIIDHFKDVDLSNFIAIIDQCFVHHHLYGIKVILKYIYDNDNSITGNRILDLIESDLYITDDFIPIFKKFFKELNIPLD